MALPVNRDPIRWKTFVWSVFWSAVLTALVRWMIESNNPCLRVVNGEEWIQAITVLIWFWLLLFLFFNSNRSRFILLACTLALLAFALNVDRFPIAAGESAVVRHLKNLAQEIDTYRKQHPNEGYPPNLPKISSFSYAVKAEKLYKIEYKTFHSNPGGPVDGYLIEVTPLWRDCGYIRSFTRTQDGLIHYTLEARP